ncbi:MAG: NUDIX domain-containing protein, partial [bacterium]|nr:NUDIX domain-containing protein [bacterium]
MISLINPEGVPEAEAQKYERRDASRAVVFDADGKVAVLNVSKKGYYKLPGGGIEEGENKEEALRRECIEELGCKIEMGKYLGETVEYREKFKIN